MPRKSHKVPAEEEFQDDRHLTRKYVVYIAPHLSEFLEQEAKKESARVGHVVRSQSLVRALIVAYYEKRLSGALVTPDD